MAPLDPATAATLLPGMSPQRLGQHFLADAEWRARILDALPLREDDVWLEIGAGHGEMTALLSRKAARVLALELDAHLVERLRSRAQQWPSVEVVAGDVLKFDLASLFDSTGSPHGPQPQTAGPVGAPTPKNPAAEETGYSSLSACRVKVYGNLPYYITSPILHRLFEHADRIGSIHVVVQFEVAERLVARPGRRQYGYLSVLTQFYARPELALRIPPGAFRPRPKVTSALVSMRLPGERAALRIAEEAEFLEFVKACFAKKRKTLRNNLLARVGRQVAKELLKLAGLRDDARAEQLSVAQFAGLFRALRESGR